MTFVFSMHGRESVWLLVDRRLTFPDCTIDNALKCLIIDASDGISLLGYAGLGSSSRKTEPSIWMRDLLSGIGNIDVETALGIIAGKMQAELPGHLRHMKGVPAHHVIVPSLVRGEPRLYIIGVEMQPNSSVPLHFYKRIGSGGQTIPPRMAFAGSGSFYLPPIEQWQRGVLRLLSAYEAGKISALRVSDAMAEMNSIVADKDEYVSKECIVIWRNPKRSGGLQFYSGKEKVNQDKQIPSHMMGMNGNALIDVLMEDFNEKRKMMKQGIAIKAESTTEELNILQEKIRDAALKPRRKL